MLTVKEEILKLKKEKNAVIMAHYYVPAEVQEIADFIGDSFFLAKKAKSTDADVIVFAGVSFMAESAKILNPEKKVLSPDKSADCPMAHMVKDGKIEEMREKYPDLAVVCYINSTAALKCKSDICVTSSNAVKIVKKLPNKNIFFIPDKNLGAFVASEVSEKNIIINDGCCPIHAAISRSEVEAEIAKHPSAPVLTHPECEKEILDISNFVGSTADIIKYAKESDACEFIICTEDGVAYKLLSDNPNKRFYFPKSRPVCHDMKLITLEKILDTLKYESGEVTVSDEVRAGALMPLERMLEIGK